MTNWDGPQLRSDRLALLCRLSQAFNSSLDLDEVLNRVMDEVIAAVRAERGFVMLLDPAAGLDFRVARGMDQSLIGRPQFQISRGVVERVAREGQPILTSDAQQDDRFSMRLSVVDLKLRSILCVPLKVQDRVLGAVYVDNRLQAGLFVPDDLDLLSAIASSAAIAIENARLYRVAVEKGRMERELQVARDLQASLLPRHTPSFPGWDLAAAWLPAREVSGDYYDWFPLPGGQLGVVIADVCDKGMPSALFMALCRSIVRASLDGAPSPAEGIARANRLICADASGGMFVTLFFAQLDPAEGAVTYVNAGHNPPLLFRAADGPHAGPALQLRPTGMALGLLEDASYEQHTLDLDAGDQILLYTDGATDAQDAAGQHFGKERLVQTLMEHRAGSAGEVVSALETAIQAFSGPTPQFDDVTLLLVRRS